MKNLAIILTAYALLVAPLTAAVPVRWTVETSRVQPAAFDAYQGETLDLAASLQSYGRPVSITGDARLYWQTNGMGARWWTAPASVSSNVLSAVWSPTNDVGARVYTCFIGQTGSNYRAEFQLRLRPSPGATPNLLPLPIQALDFAQVEVRNPPYYTRGETTFRSASVGNDETWTDANGCVWRVATSVVTRYSPWQWEGAYTTIFGVEWQNGWRIFIEGDATPILSTDPNETLLSADANPVPEGYGLGPSWRAWREVEGEDAVLVTNLVGRIALTNDIPTTPSEVGAAPASVADTVQAWQTYWDGDDVRVTVTNYYGSEDLPHLYIEQKMPADETHDEAWFKVIWDETTRHQPILQRISALESEVADKADRAWGFYDSHTGEYSPDGYTQISSSNILIAAGMAYQKTITTGGEVWVLTATEPTTISGVTSNGFFRISDGDGNALFEIVKGDKRTVGAYGRGIRSTATGVEIPYNVVAENHPTIYASSSLSIPFAAESDSTLIIPGSSATASVSWTGSSGAYVCHITWVGDRPRAAFFRAQYEAGGETYIKNTAPISAGGGILCTDGIHKCRPVYNNGSITWEVVP